MKHTEITWTKATPQEAAGNALEHMKDLLEGLERDFSALKLKGTSHRRRNNSGRLLPKRGRKLARRPSASLPGNKKEPPQSLGQPTT